MEPTTPFGANVLTAPKPFTFREYAATVNEIVAEWGSMPLTDDQIATWWDVGITFQELEKRLRQMDHLKKTGEIL
jgi:hypothetical protein